MRPLAVEDVRRDQLGSAEGVAAVGGEGEGDGGLYIGTGLGTEDEPCPRDIDPPIERTGGMSVHGGPGLVVKGGWSDCLSDEDRRSPVKVAFGVEGPLVHRDSVGSCEPVEAETCEVDVAAVVEHEVGVSSRVILTTD